MYINLCDMINTIDIMHHTYYKPNMRVSMRVHIFTINLLMHIDLDKTKQYT